MAGLWRQAVTLVLWTAVGGAKIAALLLLIETRWLAAAAAGVLTGLLVALALAWRRRIA